MQQILVKNQYRLPGYLPFAINWLCLCICNIAYCNLQKPSVVIKIKIKNLVCVYM